MLVIAFRTSQSFLEIDQLELTARPTERVLRTQLLVTRMMAVFGQLAEFDESKEEWPLYAEMLEQYWAANGVDDADRQRAVLLSVIAARTYRTLRSLVAPLHSLERS